MANDSYADNSIPAVSTVTDDGFDKTTIADLIAQHGSSSATAWLEFERYKIWQAAPGSIPQSTFPPIQGYMRKDPYVFAWGNPLVSDISALAPTAHAFVEWVQGQNLRPVWCCVDYDFEQVLGGPDSPFAWSTVNCIYEDVIDPGHVIDLTSDERKGVEGAAIVKDLKKNLRRAEKAGVTVEAVRSDAITDADRQAVEAGIEEWKKSRSGLQLAATSLQPWLDSEHRRYWLARHEGNVVGFLVMTPVDQTHYVIKNAVSFPSAPRGTSEELIYTALKDLHAEETQRGEHITVTFGITASDSLNPVDNLKGWKITSLSKTYGKVARSAGLLRRGDFRNKFDSDHQPMYVCYPEDGFGLDGIHTLLKVLRK